MPGFEKIPIETAEDAVAYISECRGIHLGWAGNLEADRPGDADPQGPIGGAEWHRDHAQRYSEVIKLLEAAPPAA